MWGLDEIREMNIRAAQREREERERREEQKRAGAQAVATVRFDFRVTGTMTVSVDANHRAEAESAVQETESRALDDGGEGADAIPASRLGDPALLPWAWSRQIKRRKLAERKSGKGRSSC